MGKRWFKVGLSVFLTLLLLPVVFLLGEYLRGRIAVARCKHRLIASGEKLTAQELASLRPQGENGAPEVMLAQKELKEGAVLPKHYPPRMRLTPSGRAIVCFREEEWSEDKATYQWDQLAEDLATNAATLNRIRAALEKPVLDNKVDLSLAPNIQISHLSPAKSLTYWFGASAQLALHEGRTREALGDLLAQIQLPRLPAEDRTLISELVRIAIAAIARTDTWEALQAEGWTDEDLARVQQAWASQSFAAGMVRSLGGEVVFGIQSFDSMRKSNEDAVKVLYSMEEYLGAGNSEGPLWRQTLKNLPGGEAAADFLKKQVYCRVWRFAWLGQDESRFLKFMEQLLVISRAATTNKSFTALEPALDRLDADSVSKGFYDELRYPTPSESGLFSRAINKAMRVETERSLTICAVALKRYSLRHGAPPASLDTLVPEFLPAVPIDYMDGKPIRFQLDAPGGFVLYSVGEDGRDDGGDASLRPGKTNSRGLWDRKDCVWPAPALPDEIEAYRKNR
jgi:hypothetical protein